MFVVGATGPVASGVDDSASKTTNQLLQSVAKAVNKLCDEHGRQLSSESFAAVALWYVSAPHLVHSNAPLEIV